MTAPERYLAAQQRFGSKQSFLVNGVARSMIILTFLWSLIILVLGSISYYDDEKLWNKHVVPAAICLSLCGVGAFGVGEKASELMVAGISGVGFAAFYILSVFMSNIIRTVEKGVTAPSCLQEHFYTKNKKYCDTMTALELIATGTLAVMYLLGTMWTYELWKKTREEEEEGRDKDFSSPHILIYTL